VIEIRLNPSLHERIVAVPLEELLHLRGILGFDLPDDFHVVLVQRSRSVGLDSVCAADITPRQSERSAEVLRSYPESRGPHPPQS